MIKKKDTGGRSKKKEKKERKGAGKKDYIISQIRAKFVECMYSRSS